MDVSKSRRGLALCFLQKPIPPFQSWLSALVLACQDKVTTVDPSLIPPKQREQALGFVTWKKQGGNCALGEACHLEIKRICSIHSPWVTSPQLELYKKVYAASRQKYDP